MKSDETIKFHQISSDFIIFQKIGYFNVWTISLGFILESKGIPGLNGNASLSKHESFYTGFNGFHLKIIIPITHLFVFPFVKDWNSCLQLFQAYQKKLL